MNTVTIHPQSTASMSTWPNPLPDILHTPFGLALLEIQGRINYPDPPGYLPNSALNDSLPAQETLIGRLIFPDYGSDTSGTSTTWMKRVYLYVGKHQRLTGEVKKLPKAIAIIRKRPTFGRNADMEDIPNGGDLIDELEVVEIVKWKIIFSSRPEPVGTTS